VAKTARKQMFKARTTEEDDLAGVSTLMKVLPQAENKPAKRKTRKNTRRRTAQKRGKS
jgi:hypothetical protein